MHPYRRPLIPGFKIILGVIALSSGAGFSFAAEKMVFAHYMVCMPVAGTTAGVEDFKKEIREAQARGIDGFALNCGSWTKDATYKKHATDMYEAALELGTGFKLFISPDYFSRPSNDELRDMVESFRDHPNQFHYDGKPVISPFAGGPAVTKFLKDEFKGDKAVFEVPYIYPTKGIPGNREQPRGEQIADLVKVSPDIDGYFYFGAAGNPEDIAKSVGELAPAWKKVGKVFMAPVTPMYRGIGGNYRIFGHEGFEGMGKEWEAAINANADWVEIVTWNDYVESSYICPFGAPEVTSMPNSIKGMLSHTGFLDASQYYIKWFKNGTPPEITQDMLCYTYRLHPKTMLGIKVFENVHNGAKEELGRPAGAESLKDRVYATVFLKAPACVTLEVGKSKESFDLKAGVSNIWIPMDVGRPRFVVERDGKPVIDKAGEFDISLENVWGNFNYFAGTAKASEPTVARNLESDAKN